MISSKNRGNFHWIDVLYGGLNKTVLGVIFRYLMKLGVFLIPNEQMFYAIYSLSESPMLKTS
jgi:hypothetical protein